MYQYVLVCTCVYLLVQKINNYVVITVPSGTSSYLESCTPEWTSTKTLFCLAQLGTGPFRGTGFKAAAGTACAWY